MTLLGNLITLGDLRCAFINWLSGLLIAFCLLQWEFAFWRQCIARRGPLCHSVTLLICSTPHHPPDVGFD